jgi:hypothetical protein
MIPPPTPEYLDAINALEPAIMDIAMTVRTMVLKEAPGAFELPYESLNAVAMAFSFTGKPQQTFIHTVVYKDWVSLGFNRGVDLPDPSCILRGEGVFIRNIRISSIPDTERHYVRHFVQEAARRAIRPAVVVLKEPEKKVKVEKPKRKNSPSKRKRVRGGARGSRATGLKLV